MKQLGEARQDRLHFFLILLVASIAVVPLAANGCSCGHDFDFHLASWMDAARQFSHGALYPRWAFSPAYFAGEPRFVFYPPLSWMLGALIGFVATHLPGVSAPAGWNATPIVFTWVSISLSGMACYRLAREFSTETIAFLAAVVYAVNPYMLFTAYERTAYAELLAAAWIPLVILSVLQERVSISRVALPVALLWLTNLPAAVMGTYTLLALLALRLFWPLRAPAAPSASATRPAVKALLGIGLAIALTAFYMVPTEVERRFVEIQALSVPGFRVQDNFLFTGNPKLWRLRFLHWFPDATVLADPAHSAVIQTASWVAFTMFCMVAGLLVFVRLRSSPNPPASMPSRHPLPFSLLIITLAIAYFLTPLSTPVWAYIPELLFLLFPLRLLAILAAVLALSLVLALSHSPAMETAMRFLESSGRFRRALTMIAGVAIIASAFVWPAYHSFRQPCDEEDTAAAQFALFESGSGTEATDEYTPKTADNDALQPNQPAYAFHVAPDSAPTTRDTAAPHGPAPAHLEIDAPASGFLTLNLRDYPEWRIDRNGALETERTRRDDGLIEVPLPAGRSTIDIRYARFTWDHLLGDGISLLALILWIGLRRRQSTLSTASTPAP